MNTKLEAEFKVQIRQYCMTCGLVLISEMICEPICVNEGHDNLLLDMIHQSLYDLKKHPCPTCSKKLRHISWFQDVKGSYRAINLGPN